jgi:glycosyltransferase involved in cell wall biosynthesis
MEKNLNRRHTPTDPATRGPVWAPSACQRLSVAIYIHDLSPGGVERQCLVLAHELRQRGVNVVLLLHQLRGELVPLLPEGVPVISLRSARTLQDIVRLGQFLRHNRLSVLMANVDHNNVAAALAKALTFSETKLVICQHNPLTRRYHSTVNWKHRVVPFCYRILSPWIDHAVAVSDGLAAELVHIGGLSASKVSTINNAVIGDDFEERANAPVRHRWLDNHDRPVFVNAGRLVDMKDHRNLIQAFALYLHCHPARLIILGTGPMEVELEALTRSLAITEHVDFVGFVQNPLPYMRAADAFVLSSYSEGFGNVLVEAMGCGTPVVSTDCPHGPAEILARGEFGILVPQQDPAALAAGMARLIEQLDQWPADLLRRRANVFTYSACVDSYLRLFQRLVDPP